MKKMKKYLIIGLLFTSLLFGQDQTYIDSLTKKLSKSKNENKLEQYLLITDYYKVYSPKDAISNLKDGIKLAKELKSDLLGKFYLSLELTLYRETLYDSALYYSKLAKDFYIEKKDTIGLCKSITSIGINYSALNKIDKAIEMHNKNLELSLKNNIKVPLFATYLNLGMIASNQGKYTDALEKYLMALNIAKEFQDNSKIIHIFTNLGSLFLTTNNYEKSSDYFFQAMQLAEEGNNKDQLWYIYYNLGNLYNMQKITIIILIYHTHYYKK